MPFQSEFADDAKLKACADHDPDHIGEQFAPKGPWVVLIKKALNAWAVKQQPPVAQLSLSEQFDRETGDLVALFKARQNPPILNYAGKIDRIVGRKTVVALDKELPRRGGGVVPPPPPIVGQAGVQIGPLGPRSRFVDEYYDQCGLETIGPGQIQTNGPRHYTTFEALIDVLLSRVEMHQVIVNHGSRFKGLSVPFAKGSIFDGTGNVVGILSLLADQEERHALDPSGFGVAEAALKMGVTNATAVRIVRKLVELRKKQFVFHFRACTIGENVGMLHDYKDAFGARMITFHACRLLFMPFILDQMKPGHRVADFSSDKNTAKARLRTFDDPIGLLSPMMLALVDVDGHSHVTQESFIEQRSSNQIKGWAECLLRRWQDTAPDRLVVPIMWENTERTFHCPLESGWRQKLAFV